MTEHSISQVARMSGVTTRTLRHYDELGLLTPTRTGTNGYRWYDRSALRRLQRILVLRDAGVPLADIAAALTEGGDEREALREQLTRVRAERRRLRELETTLRRSLDELEGRDRLEDAEFFAGLDRGRAALAAGLRKRWGDGADVAVRGHAVQTRTWTRDRYDAVVTEGDDLFGRMSRARRHGIAPDSSEAQALVAEHHDAVAATFPEPAALTMPVYAGLAELTTSDAQQRAIVGARDPDLPEWLAAAIGTYVVRTAARTTG